MDNNLPELRDIHLPDGVSVWPPAYGWYVILLSVIGIFLLYELYRLWRRKSKKLYALRLLAQANNFKVVAAARQMSEILRRICIFKYPEAAALFGKPWIDFLNNHTKMPISGKAALLLSDAPYISVKSTRFNAEDLEELRRFCQNWIGENL